MSGYWQRLIFFIVFIMVINSLYFFANQSSSLPGVALIPYSFFRQELSAGRVAEVTIEEDDMSGRFVYPLELSAVQLDAGQFEGTRSFEHFQTILPPLVDTGLMELLEEHQVRVSAQKTDARPVLVEILLALLPWVLLIGLWWFIIMKVQQKGGLGGSLMQRFGQSGAQLYSREQSPVNFTDVAGLAEAKQELLDIIAFLRQPQKFSRLGGRVPRGVLLTGPPGTGKTLMARAVAGEAKVPFFSISASQFIEMFVGVGASRVRDLFMTAKKNSPSIIFIDELDAVGRSRGTGMGGGNDEREQTLNQLLSELDGFEDHSQVIVLAATNRPDVLDPALLRPGRFDRQVVIERPDWRDRVKILEVHTGKMPLAADVDLVLIARGTPGMVGADLQSLVNEAALIAARTDAETITKANFEQAKDRQLMGLERKLFLSQREKQITAVHEAGHALTARCLPNTDPVYKVTIIPRGQALGLTQQLPEEDQYHFQRSSLLARLGVILGGRIAEKLIFDEYSSGAQSDLKQVTELAEKMVCQWGMSERLGPLSYPRGEEHPFLGRKLAIEKNFSEQTAWIIDQEVEKLVLVADQCVRAVVAANRDTLEALAERLMAEESLDRELLEDFFGEHSLVFPREECQELCGTTQDDSGEPRA
jgi:cell division protease FtsH